MSNKKNTANAPAADTGTKRVIAIAKGFHGRLREIGDEFDVGSEETGKWFTEVKTLEKPATDGAADLV